jgi:hypothetical protein
MSLKGLFTHPNKDIVALGVKNQNPLRMSAKRLGSNNQRTYIDYKMARRMANWV